jgi:5-hydroxyisourate hydrolase
MKTSRSPVTTHVLDTSRGKPAAGIQVTLEVQSADQNWKSVGTAKTDPSGRIENFLESLARAKPGVYRMVFETELYFQNLKMETFYPTISIVFQIRNAEEHYHVPLLLSPYGYSTYRGT